MRRRLNFPGVLAAAVLLSLGGGAAALQIGAEDKQLDHQRRMREIEEHHASGAYRRIVPPSELGIRDEAFVAGVKGAFCNSWSDYLNGKLYGVVAGYELADPAAGIVYIVEGTRSGHLERFAAPAATGPLCIVSAKGGVLALRSQPGEYERDTQNDHGAGRFVTVGGGRTYRFDLRAEKFVK
jgi:hypothetical protein